MNWTEVGHERFVRIQIDAFWYLNRRTKEESLVSLDVLGDAIATKLGLRKSGVLDNQVFQTIVENWLPVKLEKESGVVSVPKVPHPWTEAFAHLTDERNKVNAIRHLGTAYEQDLAKADNDFDKLTALIRANTSIMEVFPELGRECVRQISVKRQLWGNSAS